MPKINVPQKNLVIDCNAGENAMDVLINAGLPVASSCLGEGICSKCAVKVWPQGQASELEIRTLTRNKMIDSNLRLSCQMLIQEDITVETTYW